MQNKNESLMFRFAQQKFFVIVIARARKLLLCKTKMSHLHVGNYKYICTYE